MGFKICISVFLVFAAQLAVLAGTQRVRLAWTDDPSTTVTICWEQTGPSEAVIHYDTVDRGADWKKYKARKGPNYLVDHKDMKNRVATLAGLQPGTRYYFLLRDADGSGRRLSFRTAPAGPEPFTFVMGGDSSTNREARRRANLTVAKLSPLFVAFNGNFTASGTPEEWMEWLDDWQLTISDDGLVAPIIPAVGRRELNLETPTDISAIFGLGESVRSSLGFGGAYFRIWTLDSESQDVQEEQAGWLAADLDTHSNTLWKVVQYHSPMRPHLVAYGNGDRQYSLWAGLFHNARVNVVSECGPATCKITRPVRPATGEGSEDGFVRDDSSGAVYIGEGCWGSSVKPADNRRSWTLDCADVNQFFWICVSPSQLMIRAVLFDDAPDNVAPASKLRSVFDVPDNLPLWEPAGISGVRLGTGKKAEPTLDGDF